MPMYTVRCSKCGTVDDIYRSLSEWEDLPSCCGKTVERQISAPHIISDIETYKAVGFDVVTGEAPVIRSRSEHRDYLKRNGYVELGNEKLPDPPSITRDLDSPRETIVNAYKQVTGNI